MSEPALTRAAAAASHPIHILNEIPEEQRAEFGVRPFMLRHRLGESPLFSLEALERVAVAVQTAQIEGRARDAQLKIRFDKEDAGDMSSWKAKRFVTLSDDAGWRGEIARLFGELATGRARWSMMISFVDEIDADFRELVDELILEAAGACGFRRSDVTLRGATVILSSPCVITPYHADYEHNFLFQILGGKDDHLYDQNDPAIMPQEVIERFGFGDRSAASYGPHADGRGKLFHLEPGVVVYQPPLAPHWLENGDNASISVAIYFSTRRLDDFIHAHQVNWFLRRAGLHPPAPDLSRGVDRAKAAFMRALSGRRDRYDALFRGVERLKAPGLAVRGLASSMRARLAA
ncbi:hypothetical protein [Methylocella sp.]|uniref:hypothetical protein n=1 Tax=Methylocella sp. TaxID=1978226 RepID=UPI0035B3B44D